MKKIWYIIVMLFVLGLVACSSNEMVNEESEMVDTVAEEAIEEATTEEADDEKEEAAAEEKVFNAETLSVFNGKDGQPAYVAVDGVVYDVTDVKAWQSPHAGKFEPGQDYSDKIGQSPHGTNKLKGLTKVGTYEE